ncbi:uncharacterized protein IUM83_18672 [Phytophthora cinnamomi]|uniref:uncharacterized protein n=1 Tax=Phytophthora cinnamomi TaxID=4785 RepID=UPI00355A6A8D|nr:hypothetical protein IUM83_18672 [Phytophthora cinnamomi]
MRSYFIVLAAVAGLLTTSDAASATVGSKVSQAAGQDNAVGTRVLLADEATGSGTTAADAGEQNFGLSMLSKLKQIMDSEKAKKAASSRK